MHPGTHEPGLTPGSRVLLDAHNAYPEDGRWSDRLDRALATGLPVAIEQDLVWWTDPRTGVGRSIVSHGAPFTGQEPSLDEYFFRRIAPIIEQVLRDDRRETWPAITLNLDFKTNEPAHHRAVWEVLGRYERWLVTATRGRDATDIGALRQAPLLVLTGSADEQQRSFHDDLPQGAALRLFGAVHQRADGLPGPRTSYRRWVNYPWAAVEPEGQPKAGAWDGAEEQRLTRLVSAAHAGGLWIRFYTLNGHAPANLTGGWTPGYNFGSLQAAQVRWRAATRAGVDFVAVDQYEDFAALRKSAPASAPAASRTFSGTLTRDSYERFIEHAFEVPPGTARVDVELAYDDGERTVIDLGLRGPAAFRGWSGGGAQRIFVGTHSASLGYAPGPLEAGTWAVVLGVPNIRSGVTASYTVTVRFSDGAAAWPVLKEEARWYVGDLHAHSGHSDGRTLGPGGERIKVAAHRVFDAAVRERLDFIALTDHNTPSHWVDVDRLQASYPATLLLHAREITTYRGHANAFGERRFVDFRLGASRSVADVARDVTAGGAWLSVNHPESPDDERCMGCGWNDRDTDTMSAVHGVEVLNGDGAGDVMSGWRFWADMLNRGHRLVAIGGSDEHTPDETDDRRIGRPATAIYAATLSEQSLLAGLRSGRVYVRAAGPAGPDLEFRALHGTAVVAMGGTLELDAPNAAMAVTLEIQTRGASGQRVDWIRRGEVMRSAPLGDDGTAATRIEARPGDWFSVILRDPTGPTIFSNAIYVRTP